MVIAWIDIHQEELITNWKLTLNGKELFKKDFLNNLQLYLEQLLGLERLICVQIKLI